VNIRLTGVDALRGCAVIAVVLFHWEPIAFKTTNDQQLFRLGLLGVELFFLISGFVILMVAERANFISRFVMARVVRLYPAYLLSVLLTAIYVLEVGKFDWSTVLINASMLQAFVAVPNITNPYWTLAFEITFYGFMSVILGAGLLPRVEWLGLGWLAAAIAWRLIAPESMTLDESRPLAQLGFILIAPQFAPFFVLGMMIWRWRMGKLGIAGCAVAGLALATTLLGRGDFAQISGLTYFLSVLAMAGLLMAGSRIEHCPAIIRPLAFVGVISYPLYLVHCTVANLIVLIAPRFGISSPVAVLSSVVVSLGLAYLMHCYIEKPAQSAWKRRPHDREQVSSAVIRGAG
jgi:peptidoglycan/LPS O-acetylase OafA/YrhL